jgi:hypothetical protein
MLMAAGYFFLFLIHTQMVIPMRTRAITTQIIMKVIEIGMAFMD